jgi:hypothetical protein
VGREDRRDGFGREGFVEDLFEGAGFSVEEGAGLCVTCYKIRIWSEESVPKCKYRKREWGREACER